jgi:hypothetical protein
MRSAPRPGSDDGRLEPSQLWNALVAGFRFARRASQRDAIDCCKKRVVDFKSAAVMVGGKVFRAIDSRSWDAARRLDDMALDDVNVQVVSPMPVHQGGPDEHQNDHIGGRARAVEHHGRRTNRHPTRNQSQPIRASFPALPGRRSALPQPPSSVPLRPCDRVYFPA